MLIQLHSDTGLLVQNIPFHSGINIIYGKYSESKKAKGINGIGKSSLVRLINYMLLSDSAEKEFKKPKYAFLKDEKHSLSLRLKIKDKIYLITRNFEDDSIYFGEIDKDDAEYTRAELLEVLSNLYFPVESNEIFLEGNRFRTLMQFFIKDDIQSKSRKDATDFFNFTPSATDKASYNFYLLGLPTKNLLSFGEVVKEYKKYSDALNTYEEKLKNESGHTVEEYRSEKLKIEINIAILRSRLKAYDFKDTHKEIEKEISTIISEINEKSQQYHSLSQKLKNLQDSYQLNQSIDTRQIQKIYNEVISSFGNVVKKSLDDIQTFKSEILENRNKFLVGREKDLQASIDEVFKQLAELEGKRSKLLESLHEKGALDKLETTYEELINQQSSFEKQNQFLEQVDEYNRILSDQEIVISKIRKDISDDIQKSQVTLNQLRQLFIDILTSAILLDDRDTGYFDISLSHNNRKLTLPFKN